MLRYAKTISITEVLEQEPEYNAHLLNVIGRSCHQNVKIAGDSVRIKDKVSGTYMFSAKDWGQLKELMEDIENELDTFMVNTPDFNREIQSRFPEVIIDEYAFYVMKRNLYEPLTHIIKGCKTVPLDLSWCDFILDHYKNKEFGNREYVTHRILNGPGLGLINESGEKAAFILQHKDGETGPLVVDDKYRGMGLGTYLLNLFCGLLFKNNTILYGLVGLNNTPSNRMTLRSGFRRTKNNVVWVYRMKNGVLYLP